LKDDKMRIAVFPSDVFGCGYYRLIQSSEKLIELGHHVDIYMELKEYWKILNTPQVRRNPLNPLAPVERVSIPDYDLYHFQRVTTPLGLTCIKDASKRGVVLMDIDDDLFHLPPGHPSAWYFRKGKECLKCGNARIRVDEEECSNCKSTDLEYQDRTQCTADAFQYLDALTVSTPELADRFAHSVKRVELIPNFVDMTLYENLIDKGDDYCAVGWAGSFTHGSDLAELRDCMHIIHEYDNTFFYSCGEQGIREIMGGTVKDEQIIDLMPVHILRYPQLLKNFDIGLAPIIDNSFNRGKSELKAIEYGAARVPIIASAVAPYVRYVDHGKTGFVCRKPKEWKRYLKQLIENPDLRKQMGQANYEKAMTMDIRTRVHEREALYRNLIEERKGSWDKLLTV